ncbi:DNA-binding protein [Marinobacter sp. SBS5]|uniref:DNA-binding protein n=1 Tax=Marinobacter sp. SBS5 TaxID=3401754 RepID=UPI003AAB8D49
MIRERLIEFFNVSGVTSKDMEKLTGIDRDKWNAVRAKRRRVNEDDIEAFNGAFPQFAYWLTTGLTIPEAGQISPEIEKARTENNLKIG